MLVKLYGEPTGQHRDERKYSPAECTGAKKEPIFGKPDTELISTSQVECKNLTMRMGMRRFTRLTNGFSKKLENHLRMLSLYFVHYNFVRIHKTLKCTPAMAAGVSDTLHSMEWIVGLIDAAAPAPKKRGSYKPRNKDNSIRDSTEWFRRIANTPKSPHPGSSHSCLRRALSPSVSIPLFPPAP